MGPPSHMRSVVDRNVVTRRISVYEHAGGQTGMNISTLSIFFARCTRKIDNTV